MVHRPKQCAHRASTAAATDRAWQSQGAYCHTKAALRHQLILVLHQLPHLCAQTHTHHFGAELAGCGLFLIMIVLGGIAGGCPPGEGKLPGGAMLSGPEEAL